MINKIRALVVLILAIFLCSSLNACSENTTVKINPETKRIGLQVISKIDIYLNSNIDGAELDSFLSEARGLLENLKINDTQEKSNNDYIIRSIPLFVNYDDMISTRNDLARFFDVPEKQLSDYFPRVNPISITLFDDIIHIGRNYNIGILIEPDNAILGKAQWSSSNEKVATIYDGIITPKTVGKTIITLTTDNGLTEKAEIDVRILPQDFTLETKDLKLRVGDKFTLRPHIGPDNADNEILWVSTYRDIVEIDQAGIVTAKKGGSSTIYGVIGNKEVVCNITVEELSPISIVGMKYSIDSVGGVEWRFKIKNNTEKAIKYITLRWNCYNGVDDLIKDKIDGKSNVSIKLTGPFEGKTTSSSFKNETKFYNSTYRKARITEAIVEYIDGSVDRINEYHYDLFVD